MKTCSNCKIPKLESEFHRAAHHRDGLVYWCDHETGAVRGLLCRRCNAGIGSFLENEKILLAAIQYLQGTKTKPTVLQHMKKTLNKLLKFLGFNVVKAKRARKTSAPAVRKPRTGDGHTHFYGDGCVPPHVEPGPVSQPNSDNGISGPTS